MMMRKLKKYYDIEKKEELIKGLPPNPTHLDKPLAPPLRRAAPGLGALAAHPGKRAGGQRVADPRARARVCRYGNAATLS